MRISWPSTTARIPLPVIESKSVVADELEFSVAGAGDDRLGERVLGGLFGRGDETQHRRHVDAVGDDDVGEGWFAAGDGAGLVQHDGVDLVGGLERFGGADQDAVFCSFAGGDHDRQRCRQPERTRDRR